MKKNSTGKKRYIITYANPATDAQAASAILGIDNASMKDGVSLMATDSEIKEEDILHFQGLGSTTLTLSENDAERIKQHKEVLDVEEDIVVHALQDEYSQSNYSDFYNYMQEPDGNEGTFNDGYHKAVTDVYARLFGNSNGNSNAAYTPTPDGPFPFPHYPPYIPKPHFPFPWPPVKRLQSIPWNISLVNAPKAWGRGYTGKGVKVAVLDTGIASHPDLVISGGASFVPGVASYNDGHGHGTHCAGVIGARNNSFGVVGVAPNASLYAVKVLNDGGSGSLSWILAGMSWAITNGMHVISMSLGSNSAPSTAYTTAINQLHAAGITVVCAAGNSFGTAFPYVGAPANSPNNIAVGAVDINRIIAYFSSRGGQAGIPNWNQVTLVGPGVNVNSTYLNSSYRQMSGTSMACPHVAGAVALVKQRFPAMTPQQIKNQLQTRAIDLGPIGNDITYGGGLLDCDRATI
jgi:subtilisin